MKNKWYRVWRCVFANALYRSAKGTAKELIDSDLDRYLADRGFGQADNRVSALDALLLSEDLAFRSVFYYRCKSRKFLCGLSKILLPSIKEIEIYGSIGGGLLLTHNHMVVHPHKAGRNLRVDAGAVIGVNNGQFPTIGDNVSVGANCTVIGGIEIGDTVVIEPGSVVTKSLAANAVYGGNPAVLKQKTEQA